MQGFQVCKILHALPQHIKNLFIELFPLEHFASVTTKKMMWNCFLVKAMSNCSDESAEDVVRPTQMLLQTETSSRSSERTAHSSLRVMILTFTCFLLLTGKLRTFCEMHVVVDWEICYFTKVIFSIKSHCLLDVDHMEKFELSKC